MHARITGGQEFGIINGFLSMQAAEVDSSESNTDIVDPLASLSSGLLGLIGVTGPTSVNPCLSCSHWWTWTRHIAELQSLVDSTGTWGKNEIIGALSYT